MWRRFQEGVTHFALLLWESMYSYLRLLTFLHVFLALFFAVLFVFAYIKIRYPFWNIQPVYHTYDYWRSWSRTPFVVYPYRPVKTKFCDVKNVKTVAYADCTPEQKKVALDLIQCYYLPTDRVLYSLGENDLDAIFTGGEKQAFVSYYTYE